MALEYSNSNEQIAAFAFAATNHLEPTHSLWVLELKINKLISTSNYNNNKTTDKPKSAQVLNYTQHPSNPLTVHDNDIKTTPRFINIYSSRGCRPRRRHKGSV